MYLTIDRYVPRKLKPKESGQDGILIGLFQDMLPIMYAKGAVIR